MATKKKDNTDMVDDYLHSIENIQQAEPRPFFYTRLKSRMEERKQPQAPAFKLRPAFVICTLLIMLAINFWMINAQKDYRQQENNTSVTSLYNFAETYNFTVSGY
jgi:hypothetical protein